MKTLILAAAAAAIGLAGAAPASAQHVVKRTVVHRTGPAHVRKVCRTEIRHHHRVRVCRTVRR